MGWLQLRNVKSNSDHSIDTAGAVFGRDASEADIVLSDKSVSKRHARVYNKAGKWFLEDLGSSNGTFFDGRKVTGPVQLNPDDIFSVAAFTFEVLGLGTGSKGSAAPDNAPTETHVRPNMPADTEASAETQAPPREESTGQDPSEGNEKQARGEADKEEKETIPARASSKSKSSKNPKVGDTPQLESQDALEGDGKRVGFYVKALPKAAAFHLKTIPLLVARPFGTIAQSVEKQPLPALGVPGLIVYALPAYLFSSAVVFACSLIAQLVTGTVSLGAIIPVQPLLVAVITSVVGGFLCHPLLEWIVDKLQGFSDERSRTNFFVFATSAAALMGIPAGVATITSVIPVPFIGVIPVLLSLAATLVPVGVAHAWFQEFSVVAWFRHVILALGGVACVLAVINLVGVFTGSSGAAKVSTVDATPFLQPAQETREPPQALSPEKAAQPEPQAVAAKPVEPTRAAPATDDEVGTKKNKKSKKGAKADETAAAAPEARAASPATAEDFAQYVQRRDELEKIIAANPMLLKTVPGLLASYEKYHRMAADIRHRRDGPVKNRKGVVTVEAAPEAVQAKLREIEVFESTRALVDEMYNKVK